MSGHQRGIVIMGIHTAVPCQEKCHIDSLLGDAVVGDKNKDGEALCDLVAQPARVRNDSGCPLRLVNPLNDELPIHSEGK